MTIRQAFALAVQHHQSGRLAEAEVIYRQILATEPRHVDALHLLGVIAQQVGRNDVAVELIRQAIELAPRVADFHSNLGEAYRALGKLDEAVSAYRQAIALKPDIAEAHSNLGIVLKNKGELDDAIAAFRQAIALKFNSPETQSNLGNALHGKGELDEAITAYRQAIALRPNYAEAYSNLGNTLKDKGQLDEAVVAYSQAIGLKPGFAEVHYNLGNALRDQGQLDEAIVAYRQAIGLKPGFAEVHYNLGNALTEKGEVDEAIAAYRKAIALKPDFPDAHGNLLLALNYLPGFDARAIAEEHQRWNQQHAEPLRQFIQPHSNDRTPERRLRIGYVSPDFREHAAAYFAENLLANHDRTKVEVFCYADVPKPDAATARMMQHAAHWRKITRMTDAQVSDLIRKDGIDILVDLAGHTADNRLLVFARKPAPVQVSWLGYPNTTGLKAIDYRLTDAIADPPGSTEHLHTEQLVRLPGIFACFRPDENSPGVGPLPALARGFVTFGSFHKLAKLNDCLLENWAKILKEAAGSRLVLVAGGLGVESNRQRLIESFGKRGIDPARLEFKALQEPVQYLALHNEVDVLLDSHPFSGHTVCCHALWMGVPAVTLAGASHCSRMVASVLVNVGLEELVAQTPEGYVRSAVELANDLPRLTHLRGTLRERMEASPLMDAPRFARDIEAAYRTMWEHWCARALGRQSGDS